MKEDFFHQKEILLTGGTGSLGKELVKQLIRDHKPRGIRIFSRDELKQYNMAKEVEQWQVNYNDNTPVAFLVGDIRDLARLRRAMEGVDIVIHAAALKQIGSCESNPLEAIMTNIHGSENVLNAALDCLVERVMYTNTDKAVKPTTLYGATKMAAERLFIDGNVYSGNRGVKFSACRYGNVLGSRGSVAHVFREQAASGQAITLTHQAMTRFWITIPKVARFLLDRIADMQGGEVFVPKMKSMNVYDMALTMGSRIRCECHPEKQGSIICPWCDGTFPAEIMLPEFKVIGIRQGEKLHESLFCEEEYAREHKDYYTVFSSFKQGRDGVPTGNWELRSDRNPYGELSRDELLAMLVETGL